MCLQDADLTDINNNKNNTSSFFHGSPMNHPSRNLKTLTQFYSPKNITFK